MNIVKVGVVGGRDYAEYDTVKEVLDSIFIYALKRKFKMKIVSGGALGADSLGEWYAKQNKLDTIIFKPDWDKHGKAAGFIRNRDIISNCDIVVAFWDGKSKGTKNSIDLTEQQNKNLKIIKYNPSPMFTQKELNEILVILNITSFEDLVGKEVYYGKKSYGKHHVKQWNSKRQQYVLSIDNTVFYSSPNRILNEQ